MKLIKNISLIFLILINLSCNNSEKIELKSDYNLGESQTIIASIETSKDAPVYIKNSIEFNFKADTIKENEYYLKTKILKITTDRKEKNIIETYDSSKEVSLMNEIEKETHTGFKILLESELNIIINNKNKIIRPLQFMNGTKLNQTLIDMSHIFLRLPSKKVKTGSGWQGKKQDPKTSQITEFTCIVKDITDKEIIIDINLNLVGIAGLIDDTKGNGQYILDKSTCKLIKGNIEMKTPLGSKVTTTFVTKS